MCCGPSGSEGHCTKGASNEYNSVERKGGNNVMILFWLAPRYVKSIPFGKNLAGTLYLRERPDMAFVSSKELQEAGQLFYMDYRSHILGALKSNDEKDIIVYLEGGIQ